MKFNNLRTSSLTLRLVPFALALALAFTALVSQPLQALSIVNTIKCNAISLFASTSITTLRASKTAMEKTFELELNVMQTAWKLEDMAVSALRNVGESAFVATLNAFQNRPGIFVKKTEVRTAALNEYKDTMLNALHNLQTNIDAARAAYREDMLALVKAHQRALTTLVDTLIGTIRTALNTAKKNCSGKTVVKTLAATIATAHAKLVSGVITQDAKDIAKAIKLVATRNSTFLQEDAAFLSTSIDATGKLAAAFITRE